MLTNPAQTGEGLYRFTVEKEFISRKNNVYLVKANSRHAFAGKQRLLVYKEYTRPGRLPKEVKMLQKLREKGVAVPQIYEIGDNYILLEYLEGPLFLAYYCWQESISGSESSSLKDPAYQAIYSLCSWFKEFYTAVHEITGKQYIMGDINFRNFIIREKIYGIDMEECREGRKEEDIGSLCAYALTYSPNFTLWKIAMTGELFQIFVDELGLDKKLVKEEMLKELFVIAQRRGIVYERINPLVDKLLEYSFNFV
ncbi:MAG: hypothetical protein ACOX6X_00390 [Dethiobacteria bacterium]